MIFVLCLALRQFPALRDKNIGSVLVLHFKAVLWILQSQQSSLGLVIYSHFPHSSTNSSSPVQD